jgi:membrane fusion protein (multidrug efflux system)
MRALLSLLLTGVSLVVFAAPAYTVKTFGALAVYPESRVVAEVVPENEAQIAAEVAARIEAIPVRAGQAVKKGAVLVRMDARQHKLTLDQAQSQVELLENRHKLAKLQYEQAQSLHQSNFISSQMLAQRQTEMAVIESELKIARNNASQARLALSKTTIHSPFSGAVKERLAAEGEMATPGQSLLALVELARNELRAQVANRDLEELRKAKSLLFRQGRQVYPVTIARVSPVIDSRSQTREVMFKTDKELVSGAAGELVWTSPVPHLPATYVQQRGGQSGVWVEQEGKPVFRVLPAAQVGRPVALDWPLDTRIVDEGRYALRASESGK